MAVPLLWEWLQEFPLANFDDAGPRSVAELALEVERRLTSGERLWGVRKDGQLAGAIGYAPATERTGALHGIVFPQGRLTRSEKREAVSLALRGLFAFGVEKVSAAYFADNQKIHRFLQDLGAVEEGLLRRQTLRKGVPVDLRLIAIFTEKFKCL